MINKLQIMAVIFDMDGLLLDTERIGMKAWQDAGMKLGYPIPDEIFKKIIGTNISTSREILRRDLGEDFPYERVREQYYIYKDAFFMNNPIPVKRGVYELFNEIERRGIKKAVATSTAKYYAEPMLAKTGLLDRFDAAIYGDMVENGKPAPDIFLAVCEMLSVNNEHCIILEDSKNGIIAASRASIPVVMVPDLVEPDEDIEKLIFAKCNSLLDVLDLI